MCNIGDHRGFLQGGDCLPTLPTRQPYGVSGVDVEKMESFDGAGPHAQLHSGGSVSSNAPQASKLGQEPAYTALSRSSNGSRSRGRSDRVEGPDFGANGDSGASYFAANGSVGGGSGSMSSACGGGSVSGVPVGQAQSTLAFIDTSPMDVDATTAPRGSDEEVSHQESFSIGYFGREANELLNLPAPASQEQQRVRRRHEFQTGSVYDGEWLGNERDGFGVQTWQDGASYEGEWVRNAAIGKGRFRHSDGDVYIGEWMQNIAHGAGIYRRRDGTTYEGQFFDDLQHGHGLESWPDRSRFTGQFVQGQKTGLGVYEWPDGSTFAGQWAENQIDGAGSYVGADGRRFDGMWQTSTMHGCGRYEWPDGRTYRGQYLLDHKDGFGMFTWTDGRRYEGYWLQGRQHGVGRLCQAEETVNLGDDNLAVWRNGECIGPHEYECEP